jgi:hypothetical protein
LATTKLRKADNEIIKDIEIALVNKLNFGTKKTFKRVPWSILKKEDLINWPEGVPCYRLSRHRKKRLKLLHDFREEISFSKDFLKRLSDPSFDNTFVARLVLQFKREDHKSQINP